jgi:imidazolonepropionase-like amidohydrolase
VHITWTFGKDGKNAGTDGTTQEDAYKAASNAWLTLMAGFTTVQSVGAPNDVPLRDAIAHGIVPGPRILTAVQPLEGKGDATGTPDEIRAFIRKQKAGGADLIKIFASKSIRLGGGMTLSQEQLSAACDEANRQGLRTIVHAYKEAVHAAALAGCTEVEHGTLASDDDLKLMAEKGVYFDPRCGLVLENYMLYKDKYIGTSVIRLKASVRWKGLSPWTMKLCSTARELTASRWSSVQTRWQALTDATRRSLLIACETVE